MLIASNESIDDYLQNVVNMATDFECYKLGFVELIKQSKKMVCLYYKINLHFNFITILK
jgi:hypothetical protein